jgi:hypothetical protein
VSSGTLRAEIVFEAPGAVREAIVALGRTEDVRFAPGGRRLAIACYARQQIAVAEVEITRADGRPRVVVTALDALSSAALHEPHGLDWADDETLVVGNRGGTIAVFRLADVGGSTRLQPLGGLGEDGPTVLEAPGSVAVRPLGTGGAEVLVCNNWANTVTRHVLDADGRLTPGEVVARKWLALPDGLALGREGRWLAVSNHDAQTVLVYDYATLAPDADPVAVLRGVRYPHGLRFDDGDRRLVVADAGAPEIHVFVAPAGDWSGVAYPTATLRVMDDETFARGHHNPQEGGPKGIDLHPGTGVLVATTEHVPLTFLDVATVLEHPAEFAFDRTALVRYELAVLAAAERAREAAAETRAELRALYRTKAWRLTAVPRRAYGALRRASRRDSTSASATSSGTSSGASATARSESSA